MQRIDSSKANRLANMLLIISVLLICESAVAQNSELDEEIQKYETFVLQNPENANAHRDLGFAYAKKGEFSKALDEFDKAMKIEYNKGYERGSKDVLRKQGFRLYGRYVFLSIVIGLLIAAIIVSIFSLPELTDRYKSFQKNSRVKTFIKSIGIKLSPDMRDRAIEIAQSKEKLRDAIGRETDSSLREAALAILPRLDDLTRQAALFIELRQNLSDYIKDIDPIKLETARRECEEKLRKETDAEAKGALEYQLKQINNKRINYSRAGAKVRTCDAVLSGILARIDATSLDLMSLPSVMLKKQEFFERTSAELDEEINLTRNAAETVMEESA